MTFGTLVALPAVRNATNHEVAKSTIPESVSPGPATPPSPASEVAVNPRNLFLENIPAQMESAELRQMFECFGEVVSHKILFDIRTGRPRGVGFVLFRNDDDAAHALRVMDGFEAYGRNLAVRVASGTSRTPGEPTNRLILRYVPHMVTVGSTRQMVEATGATVQHIVARSDSHPLLHTLVVTVGSVSQAQRAADLLHHKANLVEAHLKHLTEIGAPVPTVPRRFRRPLAAVVEEAILPRT